MGGFFGILFVAFWCVWIIVAVSIINIMMKKSAEKKVYQKMLANPCDATVLAYIPALEATYGFMSGAINTQNAVSHRNDLLRQAQGWDLINESSSVSAPVKEKLRNAFVAHGVPIKNMTIK